MTTKTQTTPTPWTVTLHGNGMDGDYRYQFGRHDRTVGYVWAGSSENDEEIKANAALIIRAVNSHDKLVKALEAALAEHERLPEGQKSLGVLVLAKAALREAKT